jgi:putative nucleotidyltransferase with HDIG domain
MTDTQTRLHLYDDLVRRFASACRGVQLYAPDHPLLGRNLEAFAQTLAQVHATAPSVTIGLVDGQLVVADLPLTKASATMGDLIRRLQQQGIERIAVERGVTPAELGGFIQAIGHGTAGGRPATGSRGVAGPEGWSSPHVQIGRIAAAEEDKGIASDMAAIRRLYADAVGGAESIWEAARTEGVPDPDVAGHVVEGLAETVTENRTALMALTAMKSYDNYTFTHMVNVSILTMAQARALGIEGRLLREFGLSALMHDIGKVRTPLEILNKPSKLTDEEFGIMKQHTVDGAEILRRTPEMPILAPVVAFEHHLRLDGSGYPAAKRADLNVATVLCSISDVYDAMRSQRAYQQSFPTDRILQVLKRADGREFDQHLIRRFVQLLGIYPPGNLVRLASGDVAVVLQVHAPDPYRPKVRIIMNSQGERLAIPVERNLWDPAGPDQSVVAPLDPAEVGIDPLTFL